MKNFRLYIVTICVFVTVFGMCSIAFAQSRQGERILKFTSDIDIHHDGSMTVKENITIRAEHIEIKRGIYRDFPTRYRDRHGNRVVVQFEVISVMRDGNPEEYNVESIANGKRVRIGNPNVFLDKGKTYTYTIEYKTNRQLGFFENYDEFYWNVTGNGWGFNIDEVSAKVTIPGTVNRDDILLYGYTGTQGSTGEDYTAWVDDKSISRFESTRMLRNQEGLTISVAFPKGIVREPTDAEKRRYLLLDNLMYLIGLAGFLLVLVYYLLAWSRAGKDLPKGTIIPLFEPPDGFSPGAVRYITRMGYDKKIFAALVINLAVKGYIKIKQTSGSEFTLEKLKPIPLDDTDLSEGEESILDNLFGARNKIALKQKNHAKISSAIENLKEILSRNFNNIYFKTNSSYVGFGAFLSIMTVVGMIIGLGHQTDGDDMIQFMVAVIFGSVGVGIFVFLSLPNLWNIVRGGPNQINSIILFFFGLLFFVVFGGVSVFIPMENEVHFNPFIGMSIIIALMLLNLLFYHLMKAPTHEGRIALDQIEGFKMYMTYAEKDYLDFMNPPEKTPELFEKYLPYALALDLENRWSEQFAEVLKEAVVDGKDYSPNWYSGRDFSRLGAAGFASAVGGSMATSISSSSHAPGSSSGSGGGGSSGGGGGGGGGGGW